MAGEMMADLTLGEVEEQKRRKKRKTKARSGGIWKVKRIRVG